MKKKQELDFSFRACLVFTIALLFLAASDLCRSQNSVVFMVTDSQMGHATGYGKGSTLHRGQVRRVRQRNIRKGSNDGSKEVSNRGR